MGDTAQVQECRVMLGVFGDDDVEPHVLLGKVEGASNVPGLIVDMKTAMDEKLGARPVLDYFWSCSSEWVDATLIR